MNDEAIAAIAEAVRSRFDPVLVQRFPHAPDPQVASITNPIIARTPRRPGKAHPAMIYDAVWEAAKGRAPGAFAFEEDGTEYIADESWNAALDAAFAAAVGYGFADELSEEQKRVLVKSWESVVEPG